MAEGEEEAETEAEALTARKHARIVGARHIVNSAVAVVRDVVVVLELLPSVEAKELKAAPVAEEAAVEAVVLKLDLAVVVVLFPEGFPVVAGVAQAVQRHPVEIIVAKAGANLIVQNAGHVIALNVVELLTLEAVAHHVRPRYQETAEEIARRRAGTVNQVATYMIHV